MKILVTGGNGFIATNFIKLALHEKYSVTSLDNLSYAGSQDNHKIFENNGLYNFLEEDIKSKNIYEIIKKEKYDALINFAAETHVDRSIKDDSSFIMTNINGTHNMLSSCRDLIEKKFYLENLNLFRYPQMKFMVHLIKMKIHLLRSLC